MSPQRLRFFPAFFPDALLFSSVFQQAKDPSRAESSSELSSPLISSSLKRMSFKSLPGLLIVLRPNTGSVLLRRSSVLMVPAARRRPLLPVGRAFFRPWTVLSTAPYLPLMAAPPTLPRRFGEFWEDDLSLFSSLIRKPFDVFSKISFQDVADRLAPLLPPTAAAFFGFFFPGVIEVDGVGCAFSPVGNKNGRLLWLWYFPFRFSLYLSNDPLSPNFFLRSGQMRPPPPFV